MLEIFDEIKSLVEELESDYSIKDTLDWRCVQDRYSENIEAVRELLEEIEQ